jgi:hypothetical protein
MNLVSAAAGAVQRSTAKRYLTFYVSWAALLFVSEVSVRDHQMCSLRDELRARKSCSLGPFQARQGDRHPVIAAYFDFQSHARLEIEVKVKFAELAGRCKRDGALAAMEYDGNGIKLTVEPVGIRNLAHQSEITGIGLRFEPEIRREASGLIDQLPGRKLSDAADARRHGLKEAVKDEMRGIYNPAKDFLWPEERFQAAPKFLQEAVARYAGKRVLLEQVSDFWLALLTAEDKYTAAQTRINFVKSRGYGRGGRTRA